jgi:hypothetical protein
MNVSQDRDLLAEPAPGLMTRRCLITQRCARSRTAPARQTHVAEVVCLVSLRSGVRSRGATMFAISRTATHFFG